MKTLSKKGKWLLILTCILYAGDSIVITALVYANGKIVESAELGDMSAMVQYMILTFFIAVFSYLLAATSTITRFSYLSNGELEMKSGIMKNILCRPLKSFRGENDAFYLNLLSTDVDLYRNDLLNIIPFMFNSVAAIASSVFMLWKINIWLLVAGVVMAIVPMLAIKPFSNLEQKTKNAYSKASEKYTGALKENIEGYETIRASSAETNFQNRYDQAGENYKHSWVKYRFVSTMSFQTLLSVSGLSNIVCLGVGGWLVIQKLVHIGMLFAASSYISSLSNHFSNITDYIITIRSTKNVVEKLESQRNFPCPKNSGLTLTSFPDIVYENVSFGFNEHKLYSHFNHKFANKGCYAVVGESGSGKSTLLKLLLKYFDEYDGNICLAGQDIRKLSEDEIYGNVGIVNQSPYLFNASLRENITMFDDKIDHNFAEYKKLLEDLNLTIVANRVGDSPLGDFGDNISGGERQRINIARALYKHPSILILDEPTTGLDPENIAMIDEFIFNHRDVTRIVISHNWSDEYLNRFDDVIKIKSEITI